MKDDPLSFKEKYLRLRERFDRVSATQRQYTTDLQTARVKARKLKEENNHLLDLLSEMQQMNGSGPSSDSDTSLDDLSDYDDEDEDELREEGHGDQRHGRLSGSRRSDPVDSRRTLAGRSRRDGASGHGAQFSPKYLSTAGSSVKNNSTGNDIGIRIGMGNGSSNSNGRSNNNTQAGGSVSSHLALNTGSSVRKEKPEGAPKQTRRATKRADRGRPRAVVPLPTNPDGSLNYPIIVGKGTNEVIIENMGKIVWQGRGYHNHRYIFPVGFRSKKQYTSLSDTSKKTYFINEILDGGEQPVFQITLEDMPEKVFRHSSSSGAWELALKGLMELGYNAKTHASGPDMYGLTNLGVIKYIQEMPNAHRCRRYMPLKWIVEDEGVASPPPHGGGPGDPAGSKSPGRKKKINNSLYASNHEVLLETLEAEASGSKDAYGSTSTSSRPYAPRKYTKRKVIPDPVPEPEPEPIEMEEDGRSSVALGPGEEYESGVEPMEDVEQDLEEYHQHHQQHLNSVPMRAVMDTTASSMATAPATPRSLSGGQESCYANMTPMQEGLREKNPPLHHFDHPYGQPLMEP